MKNTVNFYDFEDAFRRTRPESFTYWGLKALWGHLSDLEDDLGEEIELDPIGFCGDFCEFGSRAEFREAYPDVVDRADAFVRELPGGGVLARQV